MFRRLSQQLKSPLNDAVVTPFGTRHIDMIPLFNASRFAVATGRGSGIGVKRQQRGKGEKLIDSGNTKSPSTRDKRAPRQRRSATKNSDEFAEIHAKESHEESWDDDSYDARDTDVVGGSDDMLPQTSHRRSVTATNDELEEYEAEYEPDEEEPGACSTEADSVAVNTAASSNEEESRYLKVRFPELAAEYDQEKNSEPMGEVLVDSARVVWWKCAECGVGWRSGVFVRTCLRTKCPQCEQTRNPRLGARFVQLWDHSLNDPCVDPKMVSASSNKSAYWRCSSCGTGFQARIKDMASEKAKCPSCSMLNLHADFNKPENGWLQEWHPLKNGDLQPSQVEPTDPTKLWWLCMACGHEWEATLAARLSKSRRTKGKECPVCHGKGKG
uniref:Treble clef zinc finger domain-containing protein n=1 Tax=Trypanosoma congolense (strain IL3000) TaxID=1068625 RepID=G0UKF2_TRYCI|nr:conserved hypothetical protein [Trypanosoma congolense IL3000]